MMTSLGHEVFLYAGEKNDAKVTEHIPCLDEETRARLFPDRFPPMNPKMLGRKIFTGTATLEIAERAEKGDILCLIEGVMQESIAATLPDLTAVEFGVGYSATCTFRRVFESYAWMHAVYGMWPTAAEAMGNFLDEVIPNSFEVEDFPLGDGAGDYLLYVGRLTKRKGLSVLTDIARETKLPLVVAGVGDESLIPPGAEYVGPIGPVERAELMGGARCLIAPTLNLEPFGGVVVEAQMCGTPVITTDWGAFVETVHQGVTGWRCRDLKSFVDSVEDMGPDSGAFDRADIRRRAVERWSTDVVRHRYARYFERVVPSPEPVRGV